MGLGSAKPSAQPMCCCAEADGDTDVAGVPIVDQRRSDFSPRVPQVEKAVLMRTAAASAPPQEALAPNEITIHITERDDLNVDLGTDMAILHVRDGFFKSWNDRNPTQTVGFLDRIVSMNGLTSIEVITEKLQKPGNLVAIVRKAREFSVTIDKAGKSLGLELGHSGNASLQIRGLRAGMVEEHNRTCAPELRIVPGDRLVAVCGARLWDSGESSLVARGDSQRMLELIKQCEVVELTISHTRVTKNAL